MISGAIYLKGRADGRATVLEGMAAGRITILKDGRAIDEEVFKASDPVLCGLLGGCLPE
jgi:hypothetical protein